MKLKVTDPILDFDGTPALESGTENILTFRTVFTTAVNGVLPGEKSTAEEKAQRYAIGVKIYKSVDVNITFSEAVLLRERVGEIYPPLVYGRVCDALDTDKSDDPQTPDPAAPIVPPVPSETPQA